MSDEINTNANEFVVPEAYKGQAWADSIESVDKLWDKIANQEKVIRGRALPLADASKEEWQGHINKVKEIAEKQDFKDLELGDIESKLKEVGIVKAQAKTISDILKQKDADYTEKFNRDNLQIDDDVKQKADIFLKDAGVELNLDVFSNEALQELNKLASASKDRYIIEESKVAANLNTNPVGHKKKGICSEYVQEVRDLKLNPDWNSNDLEKIQQKYGVGKYAEQ